MSELFEKADLALENSLTHKDQAPDTAPSNVNSEQAPSEAPSQASSQQPTAAQVQQKIEEILDLDKHEKFRWQGKDWTKDELRRSTLLMKDYTQKTQKLSEEKKWDENFSADIPKLLANPALMSQLKEIYPKAYHARAEQILNGWMATQSMKKDEPTMQGQPQVGQESVKKAFDLDPSHPVMRKVQFLEDKLSKLLSENEESIKAKNLAEISAIQDELDKKYELADSEAVIARMTVLREEYGMKPTKELWEKLYQQSHEKISKKANALQSKLIEEQKKASSKAQDMAPGGGIAGQAPRRLKLDEVADAAIAALTRK